MPYYVLFNRYTNQLRAFVLRADFYQELQLSEPRVWMPGIELSLGLWLGEYQGIHCVWLRWYDAGGNWIPTAEEREALAQQQALAAYQQAEAERQRAEAERQRAEQAQAQLEALQRRLRELGIDPDISGEG